MSMRTTYVGLGANLGERSGNLAQAVQALRRLGRVAALSSIYETAPVGVDGPPFLNMVVALEHALEPAALTAALRDLERRLGRARGAVGAARPIDLDALDLATVGGRPYYLAAAAELAPDYAPAAGAPTLARLAEGLDRARVTRRDHAPSFRADRQSGAPEVALAIDQVGVARVRRGVELVVDGRAQLVLGAFTLTADLASDRAGVHMSRFSEHLEATTLEVLAAAPATPRVEAIVEAVAAGVVAAQGAERAEVAFEAPFTIERWTPVSGRRGQEAYLLRARAYATKTEVRVLIGVEVEGMTACPCAQAMMREQGLRDLEAAGIDAAVAERALDALPAATHNQRGRGSILIGLPPGAAGALEAVDLVELVEASMSSETYELLKRPDEFYVVAKAHRNPRFVEDVVRGILRRALDRYEDLPDATYIEVAQVNDESIHKHDAVARAAGTFGELRAELAGRGAGRRSRRAEWLAT